MNENIIDDLKFKLLPKIDTSDLWSENLEIFFVLKGSGILQIDRKENIYELSGGDIFVVNRYQFRNVTLNSNGIALALSISPTFLMDLCPENFSTTFDCRSFLYDKVDQEPFNQLRCGFANVFEAYCKTERSSPVLIRGRAGILLNDLIRYFTTKNPNKIKSKKSAFKHLKMMTDYIHKNYNEEITLQRLSDGFFLSKSYISHLFKDYTKKSLTMFLNDVRLNRALRLLMSDATITEIAGNTGFKDSKAFIEVFKKKYSLTPGKYRKKYGNVPSPRPNIFFQDDIYEMLEIYIDSPLLKQELTKPTEVCEMVCDVSIQKEKLAHSWRNLLNAGYAKDIRTVNVRLQIERILENMDFKYIRIKGCLDDELAVCKRIGGKLSFNFVLFDECIDFILSKGVIPWIDLNSVPADIARKKKDNQSLFQSLFPDVNLTSDNHVIPQKHEEWLQVVEVIVEHLKEKYSDSRLDKWIITPFSSLSYYKYGVFSKEEYMKIYGDTVKRIREKNSKFKIAGGNIEINDTQLMKWFLQECKKMEVEPDILTLYSYNVTPPEMDNTGLELHALDETLPLAISDDEQYITNHTRIVNKIINDLKISDLSIVITEWNSTIWQRDLCNDTCFKSTFIFKNVLENYDKTDGMGYWSLSDNTEELFSADKIFHGGFGLLTRNNLAKPAYRAFELLNKIGNNFLSKGKGYFITKNTQDDIQIFLYNYAHYDTLYRYRHVPKQLFTDRYQVLNSCISKQFHIKLSNLHPGKYVVNTYSIRPEVGNVYDAWLRMGMPEVDEIVRKYLIGQSYPEFIQNIEEVKQELILRTTMKPNEVKVITVKRRGCE